jgi:CPA2 family monovalent cation:H+ antiporter-2
MSLAQIGEFSFIIAAVGVESGTIGDFLYPVAVAVSVITAFTTPWLIRSSARTSMFVDRRLPKPLQTFVSLYASWLDQLRMASPAERGKRRVRRLIRVLALDAALLAAIVIAAALGMGDLRRLLRERFHLPDQVGRVLVIATALLLSAPFLVGIVRVARSLGARLAESAFPATKDDRVDLAAAPRRALVVTFQLATVLLVGIPMLALTQPFLSPLYGMSVLVLLLVLLGIAFWRRATNLQDHVQAGVEVIIEALGRQSGKARPPSLYEIHALLPGLGPVTPVRLDSRSPVVGATLTEINLRARSGASVIAILRGTESLPTTGREKLRGGDMLALAGTHDAIQAALLILCGGEISTNDHASP